MDLKEIMAISGYPGLFKHISQGRNGIIVESLTDKKRMPAYANMKVSALADIAIFIEDGEIPLKDVFKKIYEKEEGGSAIDPKASSQEIKNYFESLVPEYDKERVYVSDMKKIFTWYNILQSLNMIDFTEVEEKAGETEIEGKVGETDEEKAGDKEVGEIVAETKAEKKVVETKGEKKVVETKGEKKAGEKEVDGKAGETEIEEKSGEKEVDGKAGETKGEKKVVETKGEKKVAEKEVEKKAGETKV